MAVCRSCDAPIVWAATEARADKDTGEITKASRAIPLDADPDNPTHALQRSGGNLIYTGDRDAKGTLVVRYVPTSAGRMVTHFATCPRSAENRRKR